MPSKNSQQPNNTRFTQPHVDSWYAASANPELKFPTLQGESTADVCIIGGGYTGLSSALELLKCGIRVTLLEDRNLEARTRQPPAGGESRQPGQILRSGLEAVGELLEVIELRAAHARAVIAQVRREVGTPQRSRERDSTGRKPRQNPCFE